MKFKSALLGVFFTLLALPAIGQTVNTRPVTEAQVLTGGTLNSPTPAACSGTPVHFPISNFSQSDHYVTYFTAGTPTSFSLIIEATFDNSHFFQISDMATDPVSGQIKAAGYLPLARITVTCAGGTSPTFVAFYSGTPNPNDVAFTQLDSGVYQKVVTDGGAAGTNITTTFLTPYGNSAGWVVIQSPGAGNFGSSGTITVSYSDQCNNNSPINSFKLAGSFSILGSNNVPQAFAVPSFPTCAVTVAYVHGTGATGTVSIEYNFLKPGAAAIPYQQAYIHTATTTAVKDGPGSLHLIAVNATVASETIKIFDLPAASCTGTPTTNPRGVLTLSATIDQPFSQMYDIQMTLGVCILTSDAADLTIAFD